MSNENSFSHRPAREPAPEAAGENVFAEAWEKLVIGSREKLKGIVFHTQREATIAASLIAWLGSRTGGALILEAQRLELYFENKEGAWLAAWGLQKKSSEYLSGAPPAEVPKTGTSDPFRELSEATNEPLTPQDCEIAKQLILWLASDPGQEFIINCQTEIERIKSSRSN